MELKNKKGITPVIAVVMLLLVTVGVVGVSSVWFSGILSASTKKFISIPAGGAYCSGGEIKVYALNNGDTTITTQDIVVAQVDGADVKGTPFFGDISSGLVGWWKFDENSGGTAYDSSGVAPPNNGNLQPSCPNCPVWTNGKAKNALKFDGVDDYVDLGAGSSLNIKNAITVSAWVKSDSLQSDKYVVTRGNTGAGNGWMIYENNPGEIRIWLSASSNVIATYANALSAGKWTPITFTYDGANLILYTDGIPRNTVAVTGLIVYGSVNNAMIGFADGGVSTRTFNGMIDEVKIYNKASADVNIQPGGSGLVINYPGIEGRHTVRVGTSSGVAETGVTCV